MAHTANSAQGQDPAGGAGWVGGYHLRVEIGRGGTGTVWDAEDEGGNRVALKLLHPSLASTEEARLRLLREARLVNQVRSPHVARVLDVEADAYTPFVVTELVQGPTLESELLRLSYNPADAAQLGSELADTLDAIHAAGIAHRDLKPSNVILTTRGPTLIDFGIAHGEDDNHLTRTGSVTGTAGYVAPELLTMAKPTIEQLQNGDWFAWAATLLKTVSGRPPFGSGRADVILQRVFEGRPDLAGLDDQIAQAFLWALRPDADERLAPDDLLRCLQGAKLVFPAPQPEADQEKLPQQPQLQPPPVDSLQPQLAPPSWPELPQQPLQPPQSQGLAPHMLVGENPHIGPLVDPPPTGPTGMLGLLATIGMVGSLAWLPAFWHLQGLLVLIGALAALQVSGALTINAWKRRVHLARGSGQRAFVAAMTTPWRAVTAVVNLLPGLLVGGLVAYFIGLAQQQIYAGIWNLTGPLEWVGWVGATGTTWAAGELLIWLAFVAGATACWLLPTSYPMRVGMWSGLNRVAKQRGVRWLAGFAVVLIAFVGLIVATNI